MPADDDFSRLARTVHQTRRGGASRSGLLLVVAVLVAFDAAGQDQCLRPTGTIGAPVECFGGSIPDVFICGEATGNCEWGVSTPAECPTRNCGGFQVCTTPIVPAQPTFEIIEEANGTFTARMGFDIFVPWMFEANDDDGDQDNLNDELTALWWNAPATCTEDVARNACDYTSSDRARCYIERQNLTCAGAPYDFGVYSFRAQRCGGPGVCGSPFPPSCGVWVDRNNLPFEVTAELLGCPVPRKDECQKCLANVGSGMGKTPVGGGPACALPVDSGPGATLRYAGGGVGQTGLPGTAEWAPTLGRNWSHDYALRIVEDPDDSHVWLLTRWGTFREFSDLVADEYTTVSPSDEDRTLRRVGTTGWALTDLDGTVTEFDSAGLWLSTTDRNGNQTAGTYVAGQLDVVTFPDGRSEDFDYQLDGKLASITELGTDGLSTRTWSYTWSGDDLVRIDRPDGTAFVMTYGDPSHPGYLTLLELEGTDDTSRRVEQGWEYDAQGNAIRTWRGAATFTDTVAVDKWELSFDDPIDPTLTTVTDPFGQQIVYTLGRDTVSDKPRVESVSGGCPGCGLDADTSFVYGTDHPLLPIQQTDGNGNVTSFTYTDDGQVESRTEAIGVTGLTRTTTFTYDLNFPALVTEIEQPSTAGGGNFRRTVIVRDAVTGDAESRTIEGIEAGSPFGYTTIATYNSAGQPLSVDPPAYDAADATIFTYDTTGLVLASRSDPLAGTTTFGHDAFLRRTSVTDANGVPTTSAYDALDRVTEDRQKSASSPADDLVTTHSYNTFGDLATTTLPEGNQILYGYDAAGRLTSIERRSADGSKRERTVYTLDGTGNRIGEELQTWDGAAWATKSFTGYEYISRCHLGRVLQPDGTATRYDYDCNGNLEAVWDANHPFVDEATTPPTEQYLYDALDRLVEVRQPWSGDGDAVTSYGYDVQDHLVAVTDAEGNTTTYAYSDRDLLTEEVSPVSGSMAYAHNEHGELVSTTDARGITTTRTIDEADRVTFVDFPGTDLDVTYVYGSNPALFEVGRLTGITRNSETIAYAYDRFGRLTQDGALTLTYDRNGNRTTLGYPGNVEATYTFDFADRAATLEVTSPAGTQQVVTASVYLPSGPLASLSLGNGATETRDFTSRYFPTSIAVDANRDRTYTYVTDGVGNVTSITETVECLTDVLLENRIVAGAEVHQSCDEVTAGPAVEVASGGSLTLRAATRVVLRDGFSVASGATFTAGTDPNLDGGTWTYEYQDPQYFLTSATGPWGDLAWSYDRIGNRLSETRDGATDVYEYPDNLTGGNTPRLSLVQLAVGSDRNFSYGAAGHLEDVDSAGNLVDFNYDAAGRMSSASRSGTSTPFTYDGRSYLAQAGDQAGPLGATQPTYSSGGVLHTLTQRVTGTEPGKTHHALYFAGRPVAQLTIDDATETWRYLTTDHLGTPLVATDAAGAELWAGPFEPFGRDRLAGTNLAASAEDVFLRLPGQWDDEIWLEASRGAEILYNLYRWYQAPSGRYSRPDPLGEQVVPNRYWYADANPVANTDVLGLLCKLTPRWRDCLSKIFGHPVQDINVYDHAHFTTSLHRGMITTRRNRIYLPGACNDFWRRPIDVLHEYYHVIDQWGTARLTEVGYAVEIGRRFVGGDDPHWDNSFEREARFFARHHLRNFKDCLGCAPIPPDPPQPNWNICPPGVSARTRGIGSTCD